MSFKLFDQVQLGNEDMDLGETGPLDVSEVIVAQEAMSEIDAIAADAGMLTASIDLSQTLSDNLEKQIGHESAMLEKPESITGATVVLSHESLVNAAAMMGAEDTLATLSIEAMEANPVRSLEISIEEKQSMVSKIIETIKIGLQKFGLMIKKLYVKVVVAMTGIEKS